MTRPTEARTVVPLQPQPMADPNTDAALAEHLLALAPDDREARVLEDCRFHRQSLATLFTRHAENAFDNGASAGEAVAAAVLAVTIATTLPPNGSACLQRTVALTAWLLGKALLRTGDEDLAEEAFDSIDTLLPGTDLSEEHALGPTGLARLRWHQARPDEAAALFIRAAAVFSELHEPDGTAACHAQAGFVLLGEGDLGPAKDALQAAYRAIDERCAPSLTVLVCLALAGCETGLGSQALARDYLDRARRVASSAPRQRSVILGSWWQALVAHLVGPPGQTEADVADIRRDLLQQRQQSDSIRVTFHQLLMRIDADPSASVADLTTALAVAFPIGAVPWAQEMAALGGLAAGELPGFLDAATDLALQIGIEALQQPGLPGLAPGLCALADQLLRHRPEPPIDALGNASSRLPTSDSRHRGEDRHP